MIRSNSKKIQFKLDQDEGDYPPVASEGIWAYETAGGDYVLDNIPLFVNVATLGDTVSAREVDGILCFVAMVSSSGNSLLRVVPFDASRREELRGELSNLGCESEWSAAPNLVAVHVPASVKLTLVQTYLRNAASDGWLDYEEPLLRQ